jgi:CBS domain-containing membrane protein
MQHHHAGATPATMPWTGRLGALRGAIGAALAIALTGWIGHRFMGDDPALPWLVASMGASTVLAFVLPASPLAQPWPTLGGHLVAAAVGIACHGLALPGWLAGGLAVGLAIMLMSLLRCLHPPAGGTALLTALASPAVAALGWGFLAVPLGLNLAVLTLAALVYNRLTGHPYPHHAPAIPVPPTWSGRYSPEDLDAVLEEWDEVLSVDRDDLDALFRALETRVLARD